MDLNHLSEAIIGAAIEVHRYLGPGLLEVVYETSLSAELEQRSIPFERQCQMPLNYKGKLLEHGLRLDLLIDRRVIVEIKAVELMYPIHTAQLLTYLRLSNCQLGLLINFNVPLLRNGIKRVVNRL